MKKLLFLAPLLFARPSLAAPAPQALPQAVKDQIEALMRDPGLQSGRIGVAIVALGEAKTPEQFPAVPYDDKSQPLLFSFDAEKRFAPASNFKLFTSSWVLHQFGPDKTFTTRAVKTKVVAVKAGTWPSKTPYPSVITLYGDGDPSLNTDDLNALAGDLAAKKIGPVIVRASDAMWPQGNCNAEEGGSRYPDGWTLDDTLWYYGPVVSTLAINRNQVDVTVTGGEKVGDAATVKTDPDAPFSVFAPVITVAKGDPRVGLHWTRGDKTSPLSSTYSIEGALVPGQVDSEGVAVPDPRAWAQSLFDGALRKDGVQVVEPVGFYGQKDAEIVATHVSAPLGTLLKRFLKSSDNLYGEMFLRRGGAELPPVAVNNPQISSTGVAARAHNAIFEWLKQSGVPTDGLRFSDGCGLSRYDLVTPIAMVRLLGTIETITGGDQLYNALPIAGVDGTLSKRMKGTPAANNVHAKTGSLSTSACLSGYVTTHDGQRLAVSLLTDVVEDGDLARKWQNEVMAILAGCDINPKK